MKKNLFSSPLLGSIMDYLNTRNISFQYDGDKRIVIPEYTYSGVTVVVEITYYEIAGILATQAHSNKPVPEDQLQYHYELLNFVNATSIPGKTFICPCCNVLKYSYETFRSDRVLTDDDIAENINNSAAGFLKIVGKVDHAGNEITGDDKLIAPTN